MTRVEVEAMLRLMGVLYLPNIAVFLLNPKLAFHRYYFDFTNY